MDWKFALGQRIEAVRRIRDMTNEEVSKASGIDKARLEAIEAGEEPAISRVELVTIAAALRVAPRPLVLDELSPRAVVFSSDFERLSSAQRAEMTSALYSARLTGKGAAC